MLQPRETDIPALFVVFVVLPLVTYILLGKWNEAAKKKGRISLLVEQAAQEVFVAEPMAAASVIPVVPLPTNGIHQCARCYSPATTRCSQCKSVRYCSGKCQIIHWRQVHKHECQPSRSNCSSMSLKPAFLEECQGGVSLDDNVISQSSQYNTKVPLAMNVPVEDVTNTPTSTWETSSFASATMDTPKVLMMGRSIERHDCELGSTDVTRRGNEATLECTDQTSKTKVNCSTSLYTTPSKKAHGGNKLRESGPIHSRRNLDIPGGCNNGHSSIKGTQQEIYGFQMESNQSYDVRNYSGKSNSSNVANNGMNVCDTQMDPIHGENLFMSNEISIGEKTDLNCSSERTPTKRVNKAKTTSHSQGTKRLKSPKPMMKTSREHASSDCDRKTQNADESKLARIKDPDPLQGSNGITSKGILRMIGLKKSPKLEGQDHSAVSIDVQKKVKMLFPYEEFVKFFHCEVLDVSPRGLVNCGNSCYANAVLQCLTCTKPLTIYLLTRSHSASCCIRDWCLMCELEQHVMMLRANGGQLSLNRILSHVRRTNCQIGDGSQEDAHEFLRLLIASMQSICLEGLGGEHVVDLGLQETTFIQHTFGGRLRSKVKCLRCHHESERFENIMDLTLEIFGWVESLEDALTQFTSPEDLDGENMYRCGRCTGYVRARKQLSIQEAPNVLTIVLKRFQEGNYGKINKCITFPEMLDMIPFMTGTDDIPPLYMLYAVVVHLDTLNASFSGHYVSYVKDMRGNWFRIDDSEVQPVSVSQVMSEGAYILFYMRSSPRPTRSCSRKLSRHQDFKIQKYWPSRTGKSSRLEQIKSDRPSVRLNPNSGQRSETDVCFSTFTSGGVCNSANRNRLQTMETYAESIGMEFSDAASSDWSLFTSSDEASFTTESTRDSFSTVDYTDGGNVDPIASIFNTLYGQEYPSRKTVACSMFSGCKSQTRFFTESKGFISDSRLPTDPVDRLWRGDIVEQNGVSCNKDFCSDSNCSIHETYGRGHWNGPQIS